MPMVHISVATPLKSKMEKERQPGTARYGNFINYYSFNPALKRISLLDRKVISATVFTSENEDISILDIGCNAGELSVALYNFLQACKYDQPKLTEARSNEKAGIHLLGIDIDSALIDRACKAFSTEVPRCTFSTYDIMSAVKEPSVSNLVQDYLVDHGLSKFDLVSCFSVTLWIHINNGDAGLKGFLKHVCLLGKHVLIEPQPWKCYKSAMRRMKRNGCNSFELFDTLTWRENVDKEICCFLENECNMQLCKKFGETDWDRMVCLYTNPNLT